MTGKVTPAKIQQMKGREPIAALTAYDFGQAKMVDEAGVPLILVGDSLGMVVLGYPDTTHVTMEEMEHHLRAAARAQPRALLAADLPAHSYDDPVAAVTNATRLKNAGAEAVKAEGGRSILPELKAIVAAGIPLIGHVGMLPQSVHEEGGYHIKGKTQSERDALLADAKALEEAGAFAIVLELVEPSVAKEITAALSIPTIGIGSGFRCDGQILVVTDLLGTSPDYIPRHAHPPRLLREEMRQIIEQWKCNLKTH